MQAWATSRCSSNVAAASTGAGIGAVTVARRAGGDAGRDVDYELYPDSESITMPVGATSVAVIIAAMRDTIDDDDEAVEVTLTAGPYVAGTSSNVIVTIKAQVWVWLWSGS